MASERTAGTRWDRLVRRAVHARLARLARGQIELIDADGPRRFGRATAELPLRAVVRVHDPRFYRALALRGSVGAGEAYIEGHWTCDDLTDLVRILALNRELIDGLETGAARLGAAGLRLYHRLRRNTVSGSRRNIEAHYDLGNEFFEEILDSSLTYSCGLFERAQSTLEEASRAKLDRVCRKLALGPDVRVLEIGTGWGSFAAHAARRYGCRVTTTTVSRNQYEYARERIAREGLGDRVEVLREDYRDLRGRFDRLVSIEMIEAVGHEFYDAFFRACGDRLEADGSMLLQAIVIEDAQYERARREVDYIKRYIFPGCCIPSIAVLAGSVARASDLHLAHLEELTAHYPPTLLAWRERLFKNAERIRALGFSDTFLRMWDFYFCYCAGGFSERVLGDVQMLFTKPMWRGRSLLPRLA